MTRPFLHAAVILISLITTSLSQVQTHPSSRLTRRAPQKAVTDPIARLRINNDEEYGVFTEPEFPLYKRFPQSPKKIRSVKVVAGPAGFECFFWSPLKYGGVFFISPILRVPVEVQQEDKDDRKTISVPSNSIDDDSQWSISPIQLPFHADMVFYYKFEPSDNFVYVFIEYDDGWSLSKLASYQMQYSNGPENAYVYWVNDLPNVQRAAVIAGPNLDQVECNLIGNGSSEVSPPFNSKTPLLSPMSGLLRIYCEIRSTSLSEFSPESEFRSKSKPASGYEPSSPSSSPWWKFWE